PSLHLHISLFFFTSPAHHRHLPSFPTRRSSDLRRGDCGRGGWPERATGELPSVHGDAPPMRGTSVSINPKTCALRAEPASLSPRSEEHTSELQSLRHLVCRLLLEKKKHNNKECI